MDIKKVLEEKIEFLSAAEKEIEELSVDLEELLKDPKVKEYFEKKETLAKKKKELIRKDKIYGKSILRECKHPMWFLTYNKEIYGFHSYELECVLCGKHEKDINHDLDYLYESKRLIAFKKRERDAYEGRSWNEYTPLLVSSNKINEYYYELYQNLDEFINSQSFSVEDALWEHFCLPKENDKIKRKVIVKSI